MRTIIQRFPNNLGQVLKKLVTKDFNGETLSSKEEFYRLNFFVQMLQVNFEKLEFVLESSIFHSKNIHNF